VERAHHLRERDEEDGLGGNQVGEEDADAELLAEGAGEPRERVARRHRQKQT